MLANDTDERRGIIHRMHSTGFFLFFFLFHNAHIDATRRPRPITGSVCTLPLAGEQIRATRMPVRRARASRISSELQDANRRRGSPVTFPATGDRRRSVAINNLYDVQQ